jgi:hypothetical protein
MTLSSFKKLFAGIVGAPLEKLLEEILDANDVQYMQHLLLVVNSFAKTVQKAYGNPARKIAVATYTRADCR